MKNIKLLNYANAIWRTIKCVCMMRTLYSAHMPACLPAIIKIEERHDNKIFWFIIENSYQYYEKFLLFSLFLRFSSNFFLYYLFSHSEFMLRIGDDQHFFFNALVLVFLCALSFFRVVLLLVCVVRRKR